MRLGYTRDMLQYYISKVTDVRQGCGDPETVSMLDIILKHMHTVLSYCSGGVPDNHVLIRAYEHCQTFGSAIINLNRLGPKLLKQSLFHWVGPLTDQLFLLETTYARR